MEIASSDFRVTADCPACKTKLYFPIADICQMNHSTTDCNSCGVILYIKDHSLYILNEWLNARDSRWPADGQGVCSIPIG